MRELNLKELDEVSGGWSLWWDFGVVGGSMEGSEVIAAYYYAVEQTSNFFTWWDPAGYYD